MEQTDRPLRILGLVAWRALWSMGKGAGATAFMRSPVALAAAGHELHVVHPCPPGDEGRHEFAGVHFHRYRAPEVFSNPDLPLPARLIERAWRYGYYQLAAPRRAIVPQRIIPSQVGCRPRQMFSATDRCGMRLTSW